MAYKIIKKYSQKSLEESVSSKISEGWLPTGGISKNEGTVSTEWIQAVYKSQS